MDPSGHPNKGEVSSQVSEPGGLSARNDQQDAHAESLPTKLSVTLPCEEATVFDQIKPILLDRLVEASKTYYLRLASSGLTIRDLDAIMALHQGITITTQENTMEFQLRKWRAPCSGLFCDQSCPTEEPCYIRLTGSVVKWLDVLQGLAREQPKGEACAFWCCGEFGIESLLGCQKWFLTRLYWPKGLIRSQSQV